MPPAAPSSRSPTPTTLLKDRISDVKQFVAAVERVAAGGSAIDPIIERDDVDGSLRDEVTTYQIVHVGTLIFIALIGVALYLLVRDLPGSAAMVSRLAIGPFVLLYGAYETVIGLAVGALVQHGNDAPLSQRPAVADAIQSLGDNVIVGAITKRAEKELTVAS